MKKKTITVSWQEALCVTSVDMRYEDLNEYLKYRESPFSDIDSIINYANWCVNRGFKTYIYPAKSIRLSLKIAIKILCWLAFKFGKLSSEAIRGHCNAQ